MQPGTRWSATSAAVAKEEEDNGAIVEAEGPEWPRYPRTSGSLELAPVASVRQQHLKRKKKKKESTEKATRQSPLVCFSIAPSNADMREALCGLQGFFLFLPECVCLRELPSSSVRDEALVK